MSQRRLRASRRASSRLGAALLSAGAISLWAAAAHAACAADSDCGPGQACAAGKCVVAEPTGSAPDVYGEQAAAPPSPPEPAGAASAAPDDVDGAASPASVQPTARPSPISFGLGGSFVLVAQGNIGGGPALDGLVDFALTRLLHARLGVSLAAGTFPSTAWEEECTSPGGQLFFVQQWTHGDRLNGFALAPTLLASLRLEPTPFYGLGLGIRAGAIVFPARPGGEATQCGVETGMSRQRLWLAPELSLASFRFGAERELELETAGGLLLPTEGAGTQEHELPGNGLGGYALVSLRYLFGF